MGTKESKIPTLDLHGKREAEVFDLLDRFLRSEEGKGTAVVRILHGVGTGKLKEKCLEYCRIARFQTKPDKLPSGKTNPGSFLLYL